MSSIRRILSSVAEFIGRFWPMSEDEDRLLEEPGAVYDGDGASGEGAIADES